MNIVRTAFFVAGGLVALSAGAAVFAITFRRSTRREEVAYRINIAHRITDAIAEKTGFKSGYLLPFVTRVLKNDEGAEGLPDEVLRIELHFCRIGDEVTEDLYLVFLGEENAVVNRRTSRLLWEDTPPFIRKRFFVEGNREIRLLLYQKSGVEV